MRTSKNDQGVNHNDSMVNTTPGARNASIQNLLSESDTSFIQFIRVYGTEEMKQSLHLVHDIALYHSDVPISEREKEALFDLKVLWEKLELIAPKK